MQYSFEELQRLCRRRRLKRVVLPVAMLVLVAVAVVVWTEQTAKPAPKRSIEPQKTPIKAVKTEKKQSPKSMKVSKYEEKCYGIQLYYGYKMFNETHLYPFWKKLEKLGFDCFVKTGDTLPVSKHIQQFLICDVARSKEDLNASVEIAKKHRFEYLIVKAPCKYLKKRKVLAKAAKPKQEKKPKQAVKENVLKLSSEKLSVQKLIDIYHTSPSYEKALEIAKIYFDQKDYNRSLAWAKRANTLNRTDPEAWIVSAKSLKALGKKEQAIKLLQFFLKFKDSNEVKKLLKEWR